MSKPTDGHSQRANNPRVAMTLLQAHHIGAKLMHSYLSGRIAFDEFGLNG
jgi:hypothetical protein